VVEQEDLLEAQVETADLAVEVLTQQVEVFHQLVVTMAVLVTVRLIFLMAAVEEQAQLEVMHQEEIVEQVVQV
jgi:hypothetical protein